MQIPANEEYRIRYVPILAGISLNQWNNNLLELGFGLLVGPVDRGLQRIRWRFTKHTKIWIHRWLCKFSELCPGRNSMKMRTHTMREMMNTSMCHTHYEKIGGNISNSIFMLPPDLQNRWDGETRKSRAVSFHGEKEMEKTLDVSVRSTYVKSHDGFIECFLHFLLSSKIS